MHCVSQQDTLPVGLGCPVSLELGFASPCPTLPYFSGSSLDLGGLCSSTALKAQPPKEAESFAS